MKSVILGAATLVLSATAAFAQTSSTTSNVTKLTAYPTGWDTSHAGQALSESLYMRTPTFSDDFQTRDVCADSVSSQPACKWYAPIHSQLGVGRMAAATDTAAIYVSGGNLVLQTRNPDVAGDVDVNVETMDLHGHGATITNGYIEANISLPVAHGSHAGFWLLNVNTPQGHGEIDFPETYGLADHYDSSAVHWWPSATSRFATQVSTGTGKYVGGGGFYGQFHREGVWLTPQQICTVRDRKIYACIARLPEQQGAFYALLSVFTDGNRKDGYQPAQMRVAQFRIWGN